MDIQAKLIPVNFDFGIPGYLQIIIVTKSRMCWVLLKKSFTGAFQVSDDKE